MASWTGYWALITGIAIFLPTGYQYSSKAIVVIAIFLLAFVAGGMPFKYERVSREKQRMALPPFLLPRGIIYAKAIISVSLICTLLVCAIHIFSVNISLSELFSEANMRLVPHQIAYMRYYDYNP